MIDGTARKDYFPHIVSHYVLPAFFLSFSTSACRIVPIPHKDEDFWRSHLHDIPILRTVLIFIQNPLGNVHRPYYWPPCAVSTNRISKNCQLTEDQAFSDGWRIYLLISKCFPAAPLRSSLEILRGSFTCVKPSTAGLIHFPRGRKPLKSPLRDDQRC
jgi:hypothetical protein